MAFKKHIPKRNGLILVVTLWILLILSLFALGMSRGVKLDLLLSGYGADKLKSYYLAKAAVAVSLAQLNKDSLDSQTKDYDSLYECGIKLEPNKTPQDIFGDIAAGEGYYTVSYLLPQAGDNPASKLYGLEDEERRINLNGINPMNYKVLKHLLIILGEDSDAAETIASSVVDWRDSDSVVFNPPFGAEDAYYMSLEPAYHCQNASFQSFEELLLVRGMATQVFEKIKGRITFFPIDSNDLKVNVNTAGALVLNALINAGMEYTHQANQSVGVNLLQKIIDQRNGDDNIVATQDDRLVKLNELNLNPDELSLFNYLNTNYFISKSDYFRINAEGLYKDKKVKSLITAIVKRGDNSPLFWHED